MTPLSANSTTYISAIKFDTLSSINILLSETIVGIQQPIILQSQEYSLTTTQIKAADVPSELTPFLKWLLSYVNILAEPEILYVPT
jgi:hypothetical protein